MEQKLDRSDLSGGVHMDQVDRSDEVRSGGVTELCWTRTSMGSPRRGSLRDLSLPFIIYEFIPNTDVVDEEKNHNNLIKQ